MGTEVQGKTAKLEPNSKPYLLKRIISDGFDTVLILGLFLLFMALIMRTPLANVYHGHYERYLAIEKETIEAVGGDAVAISEALDGNSEYGNERFAASLHSYLLKAGAGLAATIIVLLIVPLMNKDRATPGKLMTGLVPFNERKQRKAVWYQILYRFLFVFILDGLALYLLTGIWTFALVPVLRLIEILCSRKDKTVCDMITGILIIEKLSYSGIK